MALESARMLGNVLDDKWRTVFLSSEQVASFAGLASEAELASWLGNSQIVQLHDHRIPLDIPDESRWRWWEALGPAMVHDVTPNDPDFAAVFGPLAPAARSLTPRLADSVIVVERKLAPDEARNLLWHGAVSDVYVRLTDPAGAHVGTLHFVRPMLGDVLSFRLSRGHAPMFERMLELREPRRRSAAILFADLEASGALSRQLSSRAYFELIRSLTDLIDAAVIAGGGLIGKHAGDGASALFVVDPGAPESAAVRAAILAARTIRAGAGDLPGGGTEVLVNIGVHWGTTLTVGQVSTVGRLEVTALGDEMNEAARIQAVATKGQILASKSLLERLSDEDAQELDLDAEHLTFAPISQLSGDEKTLRDAAGVAVAAI